MLTASFRHHGDGGRSQSAGTGWINVLVRASNRHFHTDIAGIR
jgi:hypothetical protein